MCAPPHSRASDLNSPSSAMVEAQGLRVMARPGAAGPATGIARAKSHDVTASARIRTTMSSALWASRHGNAAGNGADEDGEEGRAFHQRVAGGQLGGGELLGQDAVFDRPEQRRNDAEEAERDEQDRHRVEEEAERGNAGDRDLGEPDALGHERLVAAVGKLAAERGEDEERRNEHDAGKRDQRGGVLAAGGAHAAEPEQDQHAQRVLQEVVVERGAELTPEQRRKPPRRHQAREHGDTSAL